MKESLEQREKPEVLYISTQTRGIKELIPRSGRHRGGDEGAVIFSTPDKALASTFLVEGHDDSWMQVGYSNDVLYAVICMDKEKFMKRDGGGVMYQVHSDTFDYNPNLGMGDKEWTSREPVKPISETFYPSALDMMIETGVNVYFVDKKTFNLIKEDDDRGFEILLSLVSENQNRGKVINPLSR